MLSSVGLTLLLGEFLSLGLLQFRDPSGRFAAEKTTAPVTPDLVVTVVEVRLDSLDYLGEVCSVTGVNLKH